MSCRSFRELSHCCDISQLFTSASTTNPAVTVPTMARGLSPSYRYPLCYDALPVVLYTKSSTQGICTMRPYVSPKHGHERVRSEHSQYPRNTIEIQTLLTYVIIRFCTIYIHHVNVFLYHRSYNNFLHFATMLYSHGSQNVTEQLLRPSPGSNCKVAQEFQVIMSSGGRF